MADDFIRHFQSLNLQDVKRELLGSYCWISPSQISIPGFPPKLKQNYRTLNIGWLESNDPALPEDAHINEFFHDVYFEPLEQVLNFHKPKLSITSFDVVTDRNNLRKINSALTKNQERYTDFDIFVRKIGNTLVLKREGDTSNLGSRVGKEFEHRMCQDTDFKSCHMIVKAEFTNENNTPVSVLIRCEIDACVPKANALTSLKDFQLNSKTENNLKVYRPKSSAFPELQLSEVRELTMSGTLKWGNFFQSAAVGVPAIVNGVSYKTRKETKIDLTAETEKEFREAVNAILDFGVDMKEGKTYRIFRKAGGDMEMEETTDGRKWLASV